MSFIGLNKSTEAQFQNAKPLNTVKMDNRTKLKFQYVYDYEKYLTLYKLYSSHLLTFKISRTLKNCGNSKPGQTYCLCVYVLLCLRTCRWRVAVSRVEQLFIRHVQAEIIAQIIITAFSGSLKI